MRKGDKNYSISLALLHLQGFTDPKTATFGLQGRFPFLHHTVGYVMQKGKTSV
jgi:hypothetical protein